jgi:hypothetical protein
VSETNEAAMLTIVAIAGLGEKSPLHTAQRGSATLKMISTVA